MEITAKTEQEWQDSFNDAEIFDGRGKLNAYVCEQCGHFTITVDSVKGVTPLLIRCKRDEGKPSQCRGTAQSKMYRVPGYFIPTHEWYRPILEEVNAMDEQMREHCSNGGLLLRLRFSEYATPSNPPGRHQGERERLRRLGRMRHG